MYPCPQTLSPLCEGAKLLQTTQRLRAASPGLDADVPFTAPTLRYRRRVGGYAGKKKETESRSLAMAVAPAKRATTTTNVYLLAN